MYVDTKKVIDMLELIRKWMYPNVLEKVNDVECYQNNIRQEIINNYKEILLDLEMNNNETLIKVFLDNLKKAKVVLDKDLEFTLKSDPASNSLEEIILAYPGFYADLSYRISHILYLQNIPLIPRIISEYAHSKTGIDINPGAIIGERFFIDHGTGVVIGETTIIGKEVKIYQGVTLGALALRRGRELRGSKRHPTLGSQVTVYSGASVLGGDTKIGNNVTIGSNVIITKSVSDDVKVVLKNQKLKFRKK